MAHLMARPPQRPARMCTLFGACTVLLFCCIALGLLTRTYIFMVTEPLRFRACDASRGEASSGNCFQRSGEYGAPLDAIAYICAGKGCDVELLCTSAVSLRLAGGWRGNVFVITDRPRDVDEGCAVDAQIQTVPVPSVTNQMHMKNMKRNLLDILPGNPTSALYLDGDLVPVGCMQRFLRDIETGPAGNHRIDLGLFHDNYCYECNTFNGGFVYQRDTPAVRQCLADWTEESSKDNFTKYFKDQDALDAVLAAGKCKIVTMLPSSSNLFVDSMLWPAWLRMSLSEPMCMHFTGGVRAGRHWRRIQTAMHEQLRGLQEIHDIQSDQCRAVSKGKHSHHSQAA